MKSIKFLFFTTALFAFSVAMVSCGSKSSSEKEMMETVDKSGPEYASAYICPMHCKGSGSATEGKCPVCGMDYVANKDLDSGSDNHSHDGDGDDHNHDHGDHDGHSH